MVETNALQLKASNDEPNFYDINPEINKEILDDFDINISILKDFYGRINDKNSKNTNISLVINEIIPKNYILDDKELNKLYGMPRAQFDELINKARKGAAQDSAYGIRKSAQLYYQTALIDNVNSFVKTTITFAQDSTTKLGKYTGVVGSENKKRGLEGSRFLF